jgi:hypothetical protein
MKKGDQVKLIKYLSLRILPRKGIKYYPPIGYVDLVNQVRKIIDIPFAISLANWYFGPDADGDEIYIMPEDFERINLSKSK